MPVTNILFLCTGNSARSIMAEAITNKIGRGQLRGFSAGSHPAGKVNPNALELLMDRGYDTIHLRSKSWSEFARPNAPRMDIVITVCDEVAGETCPLWPGHPVTAHWSVPDPAAARGRRTRPAFVEAYDLLEMRICAFAELPIERFGESDLRRKLGDIGNIGGTIVTL